MRGRDTVVPRIIPVEMASELTNDQLRWWRSLGWYPAMAGADDGDGDDDAGSTGDGEGDTSGDAGDAGDTSGSGGDGEGDTDVDDTDLDDDDSSDDRGHPKDLMELSRSEYERLKRLEREKRAADKRAEKERRRQKEKQQKEQGQYEELLKEKDEEVSNVERERDEARYQLDAFKRRIRVSEAAKRLGFKDPDDAFRFLSDEDTEDDTSTERALKRLAKSKSYLVSERRSSGAPVSGDGGTTLTLDQMKNMSEAEINARWDEVQKAMATG